MNRWFWLAMAYFVVTGMLLAGLLDWNWWQIVVATLGAYIWTGVLNWLWAKDDAASQNRRNRRRTPQ